jgi:hypothetical protein
MDMLIKYSTMEMSAVIEEAMMLWNAIAEIIIEREEKLYHWIMIEGLIIFSNIIIFFFFKGNLTMIKVENLSRKLRKTLRMRRRRIGRRLKVITEYAQKFFFLLTFFTLFIFFLYF